MSKQWIAALSLLAAGAACAEGPIDWPPQEPWTSTLTRAEVIAAMRAPEVTPQAVEPRSREQVLAELAAARGRGEVDAYVGEDSGSVYLAQLHHADGQRIMAAAPR